MLFRSVRFEQMTEVQKRGGVGHAFGREVDAGEALQRLAVVKGVFEGFVGEGISWLKKIDAQHQFQPNGWTPALSLGIMRFEDGELLRPRDDLVHADQELFAAGGLLLGGKLGLGKGGLIIHPSLTTHSTSSFKICQKRLIQRFPNSPLLVFRAFFLVFLDQIGRAHV